MLGRRKESTESNPRSTHLLRLLMLTVLFGGVSILAQTFPASAADPPTVTSVSPSSGGLAGGANVIVKGTDFTGATAVKFGTVDATSFAVISSTQLVAQVPASSAAESKLIEVTTSDGANTTGANYKYVAPTIKSLSPDFADPDTASVVVISGTGLLGTAATDVKFGSTNVATAIWVISDSQIIVKSPINDTAPDPDIVVANGVEDVTVTRNSVASATSDKSKFLFTPGLPTITHLGASGSEVTGTDGNAVGTLMTITGTRLWGVDKISFGSAKVTASADIVIASDGNTLTVKVPSRSSGPVDVVVENAAGESLVDLKTRFSYYSSVAPKINSIYYTVFDKAASGGGGTFTVAGSGFTGLGTSQVTVKCTADITPTSVLATSDTLLVVVIPGNADTAETCDLKIDNPIDNTKTVTKTDALRYV